jgi:hypothetical protein
MFGVQQLTPLVINNIMLVSSMIIASSLGFIFFITNLKFFQFFKEFQCLVERMFDKKILSMQTDWGGEYECLNSFFHSIDIAHQVSCPHSHQQNGAAKRKHRHIVEMDLSLLANASKRWVSLF